VLQSGNQSGLMSKIPREPDAFAILILTMKPFDALPRAIRASIIDEDYL
jgi:hypothetical protein